MEKSGTFISIAFLICSILVLPAFTSCVSEPIVRGNGKVQTKDFSLKDFTAVSLSGNWDTEIKQGETCGVTITLDENLFDFLDIDVSAGTLTIRTVRGYNIFSTKHKISIIMPVLETLSNSGSQTVRISGFTDASAETSISIAGSAAVYADIIVKSLTAKVAGSGKFELSGKTEHFLVSISGSGKVHALGFKADHAEISVAGSGSVELYAEKTLNAGISGSGKVVYSGHPILSVRTAGSAKIESVDD